MKRRKSLITSYLQYEALELKCVRITRWSCSRDWISRSLLDSCDLKPRYCNLFPVFRESDGCFFRINRPNMWPAPFRLPAPSLAPSRQLLLARRRRLLLQTGFGALSGAGAKNAARAPGEPRGGIDSMRDTPPERARRASSRSYASNPMLTCMSK